ncbi:MAG: MarR family transcriptional regulator [Bacteroidota bacterium]
MINQNLYFEIELTARRIRQYGQSILDAQNAGITVEQWLVLKVISENEGINQLRIGEILLKDKPTISRMVKTLFTKNLIHKQPSETDLREFSIELTEHGRQWLERIMPIIESVRLKGIENLSDNEKSNTSEVLAKIRKNLA